MSTTEMIMLGAVVVLILGLLMIAVARSAERRRRRRHETAYVKPSSAVVGVPAPAPDSVPPVVGVPAATRDRALELIGQGRVIQAIKEVRMDTGLGLKEAKDFVDALKDGRVPPRPVIGAATLSDRVREFKANADVEAAIALVRAETGMSRGEAERFVAALE
ncbi:ribosomal protein L7/L12 [Actinomadura miaoliensis]|uniref:Large ribosomal subunit protein bL12 C-terminal domain-containing protein n=1 Tax=Actinomadura miaoliensis TaxID=430685 RepID=A0ABP7W4C6_9ACTN